jgi:hypothetical protein
MGIDRSDSDKFKIGTSSVDTNTRLSIDTSGNVGIGTNNPVSTLQLKVPGSKDATDASNFDHYGMIISKVGTASGETTSDGTETGICFDIQNGADPVDTRGPGAAITHERTGAWSQGKLHFKTKQSNVNDADCVTAMTVAETGNIGIGNTSPDYKLDVNGTINSTTLKTNNIMESYDGSTITYAVTVANKTSAHPYSSGSTSGYFIDGIESPFIEFVPGKTYIFDQSDGSNSSHPLRFYYDKDKTSSYTTDVTTNGTPGSSGAYTEIVVTTSTPRTLFYQCSAHSLMGNQVQVKGGNIDVLSGGTGNTSYTDGQLLIGNSNGNTLSKGTLIAGTGISITNGNGSIEIGNTVANTDTTYSTSFVDDNNDAILRLTAGGSGSGNDDLKFVAGSNITLTPSGDELTIASTASGSALTIKDEGTSLSTAASTLNFVGSGVTASGTGTEKTITITGGGGGSALTVQDEGTSLSTAATTLNFVGSGVTASGTGSTKTITITGGGGSSGGGSIGLLETPTADNAGQLVTVNSAGDDLVYGPTILKNNMNYKNIYDTGQFSITGSSANSNPAVHPLMNITITPQLPTSKVMITVNMIGEIPGQEYNTIAYLRRTVNGVVTDILPPADGIKNRGLGQFVLSLNGNDNESFEVCNFHYIDEPNTTSEVRYDVLIVNSTNTTFYYNRTIADNQYDSHERGMSFISAEEKFANDDDVVGAITSFTQEQALAGAGGTAAFTASSPSGTPGVSFAYDNIIRTGSGQKYFGENQSTVSLVYEFSSPQIVTNYKICPRSDSPYNDENWKTWEFRAAVDSIAYNNGNSILLDSQNLNSLSDWGNTTFSFTTDVSASDYLNLFKTFRLSTIGAYKYYRFNVTASFDPSNHKKVSEVALYGGGFTIPSQIGNSGKVLKTNGTALEWSAPPSALLATPTVENAGQVVTVNSTGTDLEYSGHLKELACEQTMITNTILISNDTYDHDYWIDLASHTTLHSINSLMNTEVTINVSQNSKIRIDALISFGQHDNTNGNNFAIRLGKKINGNIIWGNLNGYIGINDLTDEAQTDPKGIDNDDGIAAWSSISSHTDGNMQERIFTLSPHYIDKDPTNGLSGNHNVTYFIRVIHLYQNSDFYIGRTSQNLDDKTRHPTILSATEIGSGAITSFTQEQALAGAGGTAAFTTNVSSVADDINWTGDNLHDNNIRDDQVGFVWASNNSSFSNGTGLAWVSYEFNTPQIVTKYRIWPRYAAYIEQNLRVWELRAATDRATYIPSDPSTYTVLDSQSLPGPIDATGAANYWKTGLASSEISSSNITASNNLHIANEYNLSSIGAYKYYELYITGNYGNIHASIAEWALYGGGFTLPSQIGKSGKVLKTNGVALEWSTPPSALLATPTPDNAGQVVTVNSAGDDLQYSDLNINSSPELYKSVESLNITFDYTTPTGGSYTTTEDLTQYGVEPGSFVSGCIFFNTADGDDSDHYAVHLGVQHYTSNTLSYNAHAPSVPDDVIVLNAPGDAQDFLVGHYGLWDQFMAKTNPDDGHLYISCVGYSPSSAIFTLKFLAKYNNLQPNNLNITSFKEEQALAGAGGTAAFTAYGLYGNNATDVITGTNGSGGTDGDYHSTGTTIIKLPNNDITEDVAINLPNSTTTVGLSYEFTTPQIVTKYRIWMHGTESFSLAKTPKNWEFRASVDKSTYNSNDSSTYTILDSRTNVTSYPAIVGTNGDTASGNLNLANEYHLSTIGAYKYYILHVTSTNGGDIFSVSEWALYGGGFTLPSQVGNTGRLLTTNGTSLGWATTAALPSVTVPEPTTTNKGKALVSTGTGIEFADFNSGVSTGFKVYKGDAPIVVACGGGVNSGMTFTGTAQHTVGDLAGVVDNIITGANDTYYHENLNNSPASGYWQVDFGSGNKKIITHYKIWIRPGFINQAPKNWTIQGSNNNSTWTILDTRTNITNWPDPINLTLATENLDKSLDFTFENEIGYRYYKIDITSPVDGLSYLSFSELIFIENLYKFNSNLPILFDNISINVGSGYYNSSTGVYKVSVTGYYNIFANFNTKEFYTSINYRIQKSINSGISYTDLATCSNSNKLSTSIVEYLNQNDLIRIISGDGSTDSLLQIEGSSANNSFGAHLLNSGESTNPIPIYGFSVDLTSDNTGLAADATITGWNYTGANEFALPTANFNSTTGIYTIPITGYYDIKVNAKTANNVDGIYLSINDGNDDNITNVFRIKESGNVVNGSANIKLSVNDTIRLKVEAAGDVLSSDTHWSCMLLATDTLTNTRQMAVSPIVPLHQLGHDQFAEGVFSIMAVSNADTGKIDNRSNVVGSILSAISSSNITSYKLSDSSISTIKYNLGGIDYTIVPNTPHTNWTDSTDYILIQLFEDNITPVDFYSTGSFTIDLSKILTNYIGLWNVGFEWDEDLRININNEMFYFDSYFDDGGDTTTRFKNININNRYINCTFNHQESVGGERINLYFYRICSIPQQAITEPIMPSITLPTPNSVNSGKVLVSNGSGYALENSGARNQSYIAITKTTSNVTLTTQAQILGSSSGTGTYTTPLIVGDNFTLNDGKITIKNIGKYKVSWCASPYGQIAEGHVGISLYKYASSTETIVFISSNSTDYHDSTNTHSQISAQVIVETTTSNEQYYLKVYSHSGGTSKIWEDTFSWIIEDMTPSAVPSINIPLPVAANAGQQLRVNQSGTGLEYNDKELVVSTDFNYTYYSFSGEENKWQNIASINLTPGKWLIMTHFSLYSPSTIRNSICFRENSSEASGSASNLSDVIALQADIDDRPGSSSYLKKLYNLYTIYTTNTNKAIYLSIEVATGYTVNVEGYLNVTAGLGDSRNDHKSEFFAIKL